jgi:hypothetical protein
MKRSAISALLGLAAASLASAQPTVIITGLATPQKMVLTARGNLLVTETSLRPYSGRVSYVTRGGSRRSLIEGLPSATAARGEPVGPTAMALSERRLYLGIGIGDSEALTPAGGVVHNPAGLASPLFATILQIDFSQDVDVIGGTFRMTAENAWTLSDGGSLELSDGAGSTARVQVLSRFPLSEPDPMGGYLFSNIWGMALSADGRTLYVNDASTNTLNAVDTATGRWRRVARFPSFQNPAPIGPPRIDAVPTNVRIYGDQLLVSFLSGFPFPREVAQVSVVNPSTGAADRFMSGLTSAVDVLWRTRPNGQRQFFVLEFSTNQMMNPAPPGRLIRYDSWNGQVVLSDLRAPVNLAFDAATNDLLILELSGRILQLRLD